MSEIRVEVDKIRSENAALASAIETFSTYDKAYLENLVSALEPMHSDYINLLKATMKNMTDTVAPKMIERAEKYTKDIENAINTFEEADKNISTRFKKVEIKEIERGKE